MTEAPEDPFIGLHYRLCGYVARDRIIESPFDEPVTFTRIMQERPDDCRFAVGQAVRLRTVNQGVQAPRRFVSDPHASGPCVVWDLFDDQLVRGQRTNGSGLIMPPPPLWMHDSEDGMLMKALSFYEHHP